MKTSLLKSNKFYIPLVVLLLAVMFFMEFTSALQESQTIDEGSHLSSGYTYITTGDFRLNPEHPPLIKEVSALPLLFLPIEAPLDHISWTEQNQWEFGRQFLYNNTVDADLILLLGRLPIMLLSLLLGMFIYKWAARLWGQGTGLVALVLYVFEPNILAHSRYITTDLAATLFFFLAIYCLDKYFHTFSRKNLLQFIVVFAIAQFVKFSAVILYAFFLIFVVLKLLHKKIPQLTFAHVLKILLLVLFSSFIAGTIVYGFSATVPITDSDVKWYYDEQLNVTNLSDFENEEPLIEKLRIITHPSTKSGEIIYYVAQNIAIPSFQYLKGMFTLFSHNYWGHMSYLHGEYSNFGFWNYFPTTFLIKTPLSMIFLLAFGCLLLLSRLFKRNIATRFNKIATNFIPSKKFRLKMRFRFLLHRTTSFYNEIPFTYWLLISTPVFYFIWAMTSKINIGHRHILIIYPFLIMLAAKVITFSCGHKKTYIRILVVVFMIWYVLASILIYPNFISYFNESIGGPKNGAKFVTDSNIDWGQDIIKFKKYLDDHNIDQYYFTYFGSLWPSYYGISHQPVPRVTNQEQLEQLNRVVAISVSALYSEDGTYSALQTVEPDVRIGYSIYVYDFRKN
ncbi:glycosyltransferase family 39 protein [Patescibacteria group bacterium]|nr:glycosyltransferase family 39 protein [Patescibacteria group bacterium]